MTSRGVRQEQGFQRLLTIVANADATEIQAKYREMKAERAWLLPQPCGTAFRRVWWIRAYAVSTILPMCWLVSIRACAAAASRKG